MAVTFTHLSYWLWGTKDGHESTNSALNLSSDFPSGFRELDSVKFPSVKGTKMKSSSRRIKKKWQSREERRVRIDREFDVVIVPSDGGCLSGSESDDSDWSIGWIEPHAPEFQSKEGDTDSSFAVLVPCYGRGRCEKKDRMKSRAFGTVTNALDFHLIVDQINVQIVDPFACSSSYYRMLAPGFLTEGTESIERWLSSLHDI